MKIIVVMLWIMFSTMFSCPFWTKHEEPSHSADNSILLETFNNEDCLNPCWLGIEIGVTDRVFVEATLKRENINYVPNTRLTYNLSLKGNPSPLWKDMNNPLGDIHLTGEIVNMMSFNLNLCPSTIVNTYGYPQVIETDLHLYLLYPDYGLVFSLDLESERIEVVALYRMGFLEEYSASEETQEWQNFADSLSGECTDSLS